VKTLWAEALLFPGAEVFFTNLGGFVARSRTLYPLMHLTSQRRLASSPSSPTQLPQAILIQSGGVPRQRHQGLSKDAPATASTVLRVRVM